MISEIYNNLIRKGQLNDLSSFIKDYDTYEEIPLVTFYDEVDYLSEFTQLNDRQGVLINLSFFLLNNIIFYAKKNLSPKEFENYFCCLTFSDFDDCEEFGFIVPNIFVTRKRKDFKYLAEMGMVWDRSMEILKDGFVSSNTMNSFSFIKTVTQDRLCGDVVRVYAIPLIFRD